MSDEPSLRQQKESMLEALRTDRYGFWQHWGELATWILPRRYRWLVTTAQSQRGSPINSQIIDSTGTTAFRVLASGMMSGITSPTRPWFKLRVAGYGADEVNPVNIWLASCERRMMHVFQESNFYNGMATVFGDLANFNTAAMLIYEDFENVINCVNPCLGEFYLANDEWFRGTTMYREFTLTVSQIVKEFGLANCSENVKNLYERNLGGRNQSIELVHSIEPNDGTLAEKFKWYEGYWEKGSNRDGGDRGFLRLKGFHELPFIAPRWETTGNDAYGRGPSMDALGDIKQLQQETKRKAQAIDKLANPPMVADVELKNQPASLLPGGVTYVSKKDGVGFTPAYSNFSPPIAEMMQDIKEIQMRIKEVAFNDLFLMISSLQTVRTATEIDARREEKLVMLGPVLERFQTEALDPIIDRVFGIMARGGLFEEAPPEISSMPIEITYVSMLAEAQRAANTTGMERFLAQLGSVGAVHPEALDIPNWDRMLTRYGMVLGNDPADIKTADELAQLRKARADAQAQAQQAELSMAAVKGAKTLSETDVGGGTNALAAMLGGGQAA